MKKVTKRNIPWIKDYTAFIIAIMLVEIFFK
jgi:hypothetical protein